MSFFQDIFRCFLFFLLAWFTDRTDRDGPKDTRTHTHTRRRLLMTGHGFALLPLKLARWLLLVCAFVRALLFCAAGWQWLTETVCACEWHRRLTFRKLTTTTTTTKHGRTKTTPRERERVCGEESGVLTFCLASLTALTCAIFLRGRVAKLGLKNGFIFWISLSFFYNIFSMKESCSFGKTKLKFYLL